MRLQRPYFDQYTLDSLKFKLSDKLGFAITSKSDCAALSEMLKKSDWGNVSESTIYRLFFQSQTNSPYKNTLDILCRFIGFRSCYEFYESQVALREQLHHNGINTYDISSRSLLYYCIQNNSTKPLHDFFESIDPAIEQFKVSITTSLFDSLIQTTKPIIFLKKFAHQKFIRQYFFEYGHDPLFRIKDYDLGYAYYLEGLSIENDIEQLQDYIFANCVLFRNYYLQKKYDKAREVALKLFNKGIDIESVRNHLYIFPYIRFTAYKLWYFELISDKKSEIDSYAEFLLNLCNKLLPELDNYRRKILYHTIAETFLYSAITEDFHHRLKKIFHADFNELPPIIYTKHLKYSLPYFDCNGLLNQRP